MKCNTFLFPIFLIVIVSGVALSPGAFAQTQSSLHLSDGLKAIQQQPVIEETHVLSALKGVYAIGVADCQAGQTVHPGEQCTYPGTSSEFAVNASGQAAFLFSRVGPGGTLSISATVNGLFYNLLAKGQSDGSWFLQEVGDDSAVLPGSEETTVVYDTGQNQDRIFFVGAAGNIMAQRYEVPSGGRLTSVLVAPVYDNQFTNSTVPAGAPRDFTLKVWNVDGDGLPGDELYSMDVDEAADASHINRDLEYSFLQVDFPEDEESLATLPNRIFVGLTDKGTDRNYLVFATARRADTAPDDAAYSYETIQSDTRWYALANLRTGQGQSLRDQVFPIRPRFLSSSGTESEETILSYDTGRNENEIYLFGNAEDIMAQRYEVPSGSRLTSVSVAPMYDNQFNNSAVPAGAPRDFTLKVWNVDGDGLPGDELYSMDVDEAADASHIRSDHTYSFLSIDLSTDEEVLSALPDRIFIGLANKGTDENYLAITASRRKSGVPDDIAYLYRTINSDTRWYRLAGLEVAGQSLRDQAFPIRARFLADPDAVSTDDPVELPSVVSLAQNYPNPFNPVTSISWVQPVSAHVRLSVHNLLGQQIAMPVDGLRPAGGHEVRLDASGWPSGVYIYALETETHMLTRRMVLLK